MKKDKVFELKIEEDDILSGIDSISLVDEPAIEVNWISFNKEKEYSFETDDIYVKHLMDRGELEEDLINDGWVVDSIEPMDLNNFTITSTDPNAPSFEDTDEYKVRYKYILNPKISGEPSIIPTSRHFCKQLVNQNRVWRVEDIDSAVNDFGESPLVYRGSFNCRHVWSKVLYKRDSTIVNKASVNKGKVDIDGFPSGLDPDLNVMGYEQPSTVTNKTLNNPSPSTIKNLGLSKQHFEIDNEEKRIVLGPAMIPDQKIFRKDRNGNPYYVFFSAETIKMIAEKYMRNKYIDNNDQMHDGKAVKDVYVIESWIKEDQEDKSNKYGYKDLPIGTWFVSMKVNNDKIWDKIKNKELNGFSVSGYFEQNESFTKEEMFLYKVAEILKKFK